LITGITDNDGVTQTTTMGVLHAIVEFLRRKYNPIVVDDVCVNLVEKTVHKTLPLGCRDLLDSPITEEKLKAAVIRGLVTKIREEMASV
jgi:hypothetical protein